MKIKRNSWRYRIHKTFFKEHDLLYISSCHFWRRMIVGVPFLSLYIAALSPLYPIMWAVGKVLAWRDKRGGWCLGRIEVEDDAN